MSLYEYFCTHNDCTYYIIYNDIGIICQAMICYRFGGVELLVEC